MTLRAVSGRATAETSEDLADWLAGLREVPSVNRTVPARCRRSDHAGEPATWFYLEADPAEGVARLRCLACGDAHALLDSDEHWTYPPTWSCRNCAQSIVEVMHGLHVEGDAVTWLAVAVRCVNCGDVDGATDLVVPNTPLDDVLAAL